MTISQAFQLALQHHQAERLADAEALYRQILGVEPHHAGALHYLGVLAHQLGQNEVAVQLIRQAIALAPATPDYHSNLGEAYRTVGQFDDAIAAYRQAIFLNPNFPEAYSNLGNALTETGQLEEAIIACRRAIALKPNLPEAYCNLGHALYGVGQFDEAINACQQAIALKPNYPEAYNNFGNALKNQGRLTEAVAAYSQAISLNPNLPEIHSNLGNAFIRTGQPDQAIAAFRRAIALRPDYAEAYSNLGSALKDLGQLDDAIAACRQAMALNPSLNEAHSNLVYTLHFHPGLDAQTIAEEHRHWNRAFAAPLQNICQPHANDRDPERRLRIGYVSADFCQHVVGYNVLPLIARHDPHSFEVFCFGQVAHPDALTDRFRAVAHHWRDTNGLNDEQLAAEIRAAQIDILVDLTLHMAHSRLLVFARRPAPVQVTFAGYPGSTGIAAIAYRLSDPYLDPPGMDESLYSEKTIRLPHTFWCYDPFDCADLPVNALPAQSGMFITFGCLNNFCKINDAVLTLWAKVLLAVPGSRLLLLAPECSRRQHTLSHFEQEGVAAERVEFVSHQRRREYLQLYHRIDLGLDTLPYNGHTTSLDSFWMGVPVVTLAGQTSVGRAGLSQLTNLKLPELIAFTPEQFVQIATNLAGDLPRLSNLRGTLRQRMEQSPLMDAPHFARDIEAAYREMWRAWCRKAD